MKNFFILMEKISVKDQHWVTTLGILRPLSRPNFFEPIFKKKIVHFLNVYIYTDNVLPRQPI